MHLNHSFINHLLISLTLLLFLVLLLTVFLLFSSVLVYIYCIFYHLMSCPEGVDPKGKDIHFLNKQINKVMQTRILNQNFIDVFGKHLSQQSSN